jgi:hypothetical protein
MQTATTTPSRVITYIPPKLTGYQRAALFCPERYAIIEATSKAGKTVGALAWLTELAMRTGRAGRNYWWVAPIYSQAKIAFRRLKRSLTRGAFTANETELTLTLANGAVLWFKGSENPDSLYGEDVFGAVIDEASRVKEESWHAVRSTLTATRGPLRIIGNVKGRQNWAYRLARKAEGGESDMHYAKITAADAVKAGILDAAEIEDARSKLPLAVFRELYYAEPSDDGGNPFGVAAIHACVAQMSSAQPVAYGLDLAKSHDWDVLIGLDADGTLCRFDRWQGGWDATVTRVLSQIGQVPTLVDSTGAGDPVLEALQKQGREQGARVEGYVFTSPSKQRLMEGLAVRIQQRRVRYPKDEPPLRVLISELESFEFEYHRTGVSYSAPAGLNDDCVCALALAAQSLGYPSTFSSATTSAPQRVGSGLRGNYTVRR